MNPLKTNDKTVDVIALGEETSSDPSITQNTPNLPVVTVDSVEEIRCTSLNDKHRKETIEGSCVSEAIAQSAFFTTNRECDVVDYLRRKGGGKVVGEYGGEQITDLSSGWAVHCVIPYTGKVDTLAGQFKPDHPSPKLDENGKPKLGTDGKPKVNKYLSRNGGGTPMFLRMPDENYWRGVIDEEGEKQQPIFITEGAKKAGALLTLGKAAIALPGVDNTQDKEDKKELHQYIFDFLNPGRTVVICYDADQHTNPGVKRGLRKLVRRLRKFEGVTVKNLPLPNDPEAKGVDDFVKKHGAEALERLIANAKEWGSSEVEEWEFKEGDTTIEVAFTEAWKDNYGKDYKLTKSGWIHRGETYWKHIEEREMKQRAIALLEKAYEYREKVGNKFVFASTANLNNCWTYLHNKICEEVKEDYSGIAFNNGYLDLETREFGEVAESKISLHGVDYDYDPSVNECPPMFLRFIESSYGLDQLESIRAYTSWVIDTTAPWKNFPFLLGKSQSGKSELLKVWVKLLPEGAVRSVSNPNELSKEEGRQKVVGKRMYTVGDFTGHIPDLGAILEMVNNHPLTIRKLYSSDSPSIKLYCRLVFAAVDVPRQKGTAGWDKRVNYITTKDFVDKLQLPLGMKLEDELAKEIPAIASWAINMDRGVRDMYLETKLNKNAHDEAEKDNNIYAQFLSEEFVAAEDSEHLIDIASLFRPFLAYASYKNQGKDIKQGSFVKGFRALLDKKNRVTDREHNVRIGGRLTGVERIVKGLTLEEPKRFNERQPGMWEYDPNYTSHHKK
ncbi:DUF3854 domain-containing protein [Synechocystis sp. PCC 7509]|uniref:DUF3854 domain-containing protein n=1 Tax=Synechocystis sp. PCC 7509 TaxID=927677 RepID=UPI0002ACCD21|nr:DUF3854 domain-containing protein [Synechocystis sp. PCC 7509]